MLNKLRLECLRMLKLYEIKDDKIVLFHQANQDGINIIQGHRNI
jgi:hypothetical protein